MGRSIIALTTTVVSIIVAIVVSSMAVTSVYALNIHAAQVGYHTNTTNTKIIIKKLNASIIIDAINTKIRSIYSDGDNN